MVRFRNDVVGMRSHRRSSVGPLAGGMRRAAGRAATAGFAGFAQRLEPRMLMAAIAWDGDAGDGNFSNPLNWEGDVMPGSDDDAIIDPGAGPFIELKAGDSVSLKSLMVDWPLAINGALGVAESMTVGEVFFDIGPFGRLGTTDIHIQPGTGGIWNQGEWTIGGTSVIERRVLSDGQIRIAIDAQVTLGPGLNATQQRGIFEIREGSMSIGHNATLTGVTMDEPQLIVKTVLNVEGAAAFIGLSLDADGASVSDQVRISFDPLFASTFGESRLRFDFALITGVLDVADSQVLVVGRAIMAGVTTIEGGTVENRGMILVRPPLAAPSQASSLAINNAEITMTRDPGGATRLFGNITVNDSTFSIRNTARLGNGLTLRDVDITRLNPTNNGSWWTIEGTLTASDLRASGFAYLRISGDSTLTLDGGANMINALLRVRDGGLLDWTGGDLEIAAPVQRRFEFASSGTLRASFTGPDSHALTITGDGSLSLGFGGEIAVTFTDPAAVLVVNGRIENRGTIRVTGGTLRYETGQIAAGQTTWEGGRLGQWIVGPGATLDLEESFTTIRTNLTIRDDGQTPFLSTVTLNTGNITLEGEGDWPGGSTTPFTLRNWGEIRKTGEGIRTLTGSITNMVHGLIAVESGQLEIDSPLFINRGTLTIGSEEFMSPRAVFRTTGDYREGGHTVLQVVGAADGDPDDLPRFGVGGTMNLAGEVRIILSTSAPFTRAFTWSLGFAATQRIGQFATTSITLPGAETMFTYGLNRFSVLIWV